MGAENSRSSLQTWKDERTTRARAVAAVRSALALSAPARVDRTNKDDRRGFGIDVSRWNGAIDWRAVKTYSPAVLYAGVRASVGDGYRDPFFAQNMLGAKDAGIARMPYHYFYPDRPVDSQINTFISLMSGVKPEIGIVADIEDLRGLSNAAAAGPCEAFCKGLRDRTGLRVLIYSRKYFIDPLWNGAGWLAGFDWWVANYGANGSEHAGPPLLPKGVTRYVFHQTSATGAIPGVESYDVDHNRYNGSAGEFLAYIGATPAEVPDAEKLARLWKNHPELW